MKVVKGNKIEEFTVEQSLTYIEGFSRVHLDIGAGDGRYVYKEAMLSVAEEKKSNTLFIALEPVSKQLEEYSKKSKKAKLSNCLFVVGSLDNIPVELEHRINSISILFPWGSLLQNVVFPEELLIPVISNVARNGRLFLTIVFGYAPEAEPSEMRRFGLEDISLNSLYEKIIPRYIKNGFKVECVRQNSREDLKKYESTWSKRLAFGQSRPVFTLDLLLQLP